MAKVGDNIVTTGLSGKLGNLIVFRNRGGQTYVAKAPKKKVPNGVKHRNNTVCDFKKQYFMQKIQ